MTSSTMTKKNTLKMWARFDKDTGEVLSVNRTRDESSDVIHTSEFSPHMDRNYSRPYQVEVTVRKI